MSLEGRTPLHFLVCEHMVIYLLLQNVSCYALLLHVTLYERCMIFVAVVVCIACPFRVSTPRCSRVARGTGFDSKRLPVQARSHVLSKMVDQASFLAGSAFLERPWERGCSWFRSSILPLTGFVPCNLEFNSLAALVCK